MRNAAMTELDDIRAILSRHPVGNTPALPRLHIHRLDHPTDPGALIYDPLVCLVLQGRKRTFIGDRTLEYGAGDCMIVAAEVTAMGQICEASTDEPYLALNLFLDTAVIS